MLNIIKCQSFQELVSSGFGFSAQVWTYNRIASTAGPGLVERRTQVLKTMWFP